MSKTIPEYLIQRHAQSAHAAVDVRVIAAEVDAWHEREPLRNPPGMFVTMVRNRSNAFREADVRLDAVRGEGQERNARFWVEVMGLAITQQLGPHTLAEVLARAQALGQGRVPPRVIDHLRRLGPEWPE